MYSMFKKYFEFQQDRTRRSSRLSFVVCVRANGTVPLQTDRKETEIRKRTGEACGRISFPTDAVRRVRQRRDGKIGNEKTNRSKRANRPTSDDDSLTTFCSENKEKRHADNDIRDAKGYERNAIGKRADKSRGEIKNV